MVMMLSIPTALSPEVTEILIPLPPGHPRSAVVESAEGATPGDVDEGVCTEDGFSAGNGLRAGDGACSVPLLPAQALRITSSDKPAAERVMDAEGWPAVFPLSRLHRGMCRRPHRPPNQTARD